MITRQGGCGRRNAENAPHETSVRTNERKVVPNISNAVKKPIKCWNCDTTRHLAKDCLKPKRESMGRSAPPTSARAIKSDDRDNPMIYLFSDSEDDDAEVRMARVVDQGSRSQSAKVVVGGVPVSGIMDTGADITILGGDAFKQWLS